MLLFKVLIKCIFKMLYCSAWQHCSVVALNTKMHLQTHQHLKNSYWKGNCLKKILTGKEFGPKKFLQERNLTLKYQYQTSCPSWTLSTLVLSLTLTSVSAHLKLRFTHPYSIWIRTLGAGFSRVFWPKSWLINYFLVPALCARTGMDFSQIGVI